MLPESTDTPLIKLIEQGLEVLDQNANSQLVLIDPKPTTNASGRRVPSHLMVFLVGGSNYSEYNACQEFARKRNLRFPLTFGTTDLLTGDEFLQQLAQLSK